MLLDLSEALKHQGDSRPFSVTGALPEGSVSETAGQIGPVEVTGSMVAFGHDVAIVGQVKAVLHTQCARCAKPVDYALACDYNALLRRAGYEGEDASDEADEDAVLFDGTTCDIALSVAEAVNLSLPMRIICSTGCKGLCPVCGADLNVSTCGCTRQSDSPFAALAALLPKDE